jgi:hypothetical protein
MPKKQEKASSWEGVKGKTPKIGIKLISKSHYFEGGGV